MVPSERWAEIGRFWLLVFEALQRILAVMVFAGADYALQYVLEITIFKERGPFFEYLGEAANVGFGLLYVILIWDMLAVFVPKLRLKGGSGK